MLVFRPLKLYNRCSVVVGRRKPFPFWEACLFSGGAVSFFLEGKSIPILQVCFFSSSKTKDYPPPPPKTNMTIAGKSTMNESMYFLLNMGSFQPVMLVFRGGTGMSMVLSKWIITPI